jgi:hypothetical protein
MLVFRSSLPTISLLYGGSLYISAVRAGGWEAPYKKGWEIPIFFELKGSGCSHYSSGCNCYSFFMTIDGWEVIFHKSAERGPVLEQLEFSNELIGGNT